MKINKILITFFIIFFLLVSNNIFCKYLDISPANSICHVDFIFTNLKIGVKYNALDNIKLLNKIIIGFWDADEWGMIKINTKNRFIKKPGIYEIKKKKNGSWKISKNYLLLKMDNSKSWQRYEIEYFILEKRKIPSFAIKKKDKYAFSIVFRDRTYRKTNLKEFYLQFTKK